MAGQVSRHLLARYSHIRMEAKRATLDGIDSKPEPVQKPNQPNADRPPPDATSHAAQ